ncbi:hypothetical protein M0R45_019520 [Rubus argutus]|uniref:Uncharacterized protein n=1 Tax=Rubus argutus TaxID=59490 RepID=A0AAW1X7K7_RUBAR
MPNRGHLSLTTVVFHHRPQALNPAEAAAPLRRRRRISPPLLSSSASPLCPVKKPQLPSPPLAVPCHRRYSQPVPVPSSRS